MLASSLTILEGRECLICLYHCYACHSWYSKCVYTHSPILCGIRDTGRREMMQAGRDTETMFSGEATIRLCIREPPAQVGLLRPH